MTDHKQAARVNGECPATPCDTVTRYRGAGGLTKREAFALAAMQGMLTGTLGRFTEAEADEVSAYRYGPCNKAVVDRACVVADALLLALEETRDAV